MNLLGDILMSAGCLLMVWGTLYIVREKPFIEKLHTLGISDTLGALLIVAGLIVRYPSRIVPLGVAFLGLLFWGPMVTYVMAKGAKYNADRGEAE